MKRDALWHMHNEEVYASEDEGMRGVLGYVVVP